MDKTKWNEIQGILLFAAALLVLISFITFDFSDLQLFTSKVNHPVRNFAGLFGAYLGSLMFFIMGMSAYIIPILILVWAIARFSGITPQKLYFKIFGTFFLVLASSAIFSIVGQGDNSFRFSLGGIVGLVFSDFLIRYLGSVGAIIVIIVLFLLFARPASSSTTKGAVGRQWSRTTRLASPLSRVRAQARGSAKVYG